MADKWHWSLKYDPGQPRVPAGNPRGGQWIAGNGSNLSVEQAVGMIGNNSPVNHSLREGRELDDAERDIIATLDAAFKPVDKEIVVYRGIKPVRSAQESMSIYQTTAPLKPGVEFVEPGYSSTTRNEYVAQRFARGSEGINGTLYRITIPKGARALELGRMARYPEGEWLLPRGTRFRITGRDYDERIDTSILDLEVIE